MIGQVRHLFGYDGKGLLRCKGCNRLYKFSLSDCVDKSRSLQMHQWVKFEGEKSADGTFRAKNIKVIE